MSLLLDALRQAEKNKTGQSDKNRFSVSKKQPESIDISTVTIGDDEGIVELDVLPEFDLSVGGRAPEEAKDSKSSLDDHEDEQQLDSTASHLTQEKSHQGIELEDVIEADEAAELKQLFASDEGESSSEIPPAEPHQELESPSFIKEEPATESIDNEKGKKSISTQPDSEALKREEPAGALPELDAEAVSILQSTKNTDKKEKYWLILVIIIALISVAAYLYSLTIPSEAQDYSDLDPIDDVIEHPLTMDGTVNNTLSNNSNNTELNQKQGELQSQTANPALAVMAKPEENKPIAFDQDVTKNDSNDDNSQSLTTDYYIESDAQDIEYPKKISIKIKRQQPAIVNDLLKAYSAYKKQDYLHAQTLYSQVLNRDKLNVDAILGLAAIAEQSSDIRQAQLLYEKVLTIQANHVTANNALIRLQKGLNPAENESRYKTLIEKFPDRAETYAALANVYLSKQQWHKAQEAYFKAIERSPNRADYHFNLAVSLDHLTKTAAALQYYQQALQLSESGQQTFDRSVVELRIQQLQGQQ